MKVFRRFTPLLALVATMAAIPLALTANEQVIVVSSAGDLSEGLDLNALGEVFKDSKDLQHFEQQINNPELYLNNLDINGDGQVDFLRVLEEQTEYGRMITIQAIVGDNAFTDVAYIDIQRDESGQYQVQIRGEEALYGERTYYVPSYSYVSWPIVSLLWGSDYYYYNSPYYWGYYPSWYSSYSCVRLGFYRARVAYRYPRNHFHFSFNACFDNYRRDHHKSHRYHRDYNWHRKNDRYGREGRHDDRSGSRTRYNRFDNHDRNFTPSRRTDGEDRNVRDEHLRRLNDRSRTETKASTRPRISQERTERKPNTSSANRFSERTRDSRNSHDRTRYETRNRSESRNAATVNKPITRSNSSVQTSKPTPPTTPNRNYSPPKTSTPKTYSAPKPSTPSRSYQPSRSEPRPSRDYSSRSSNRRTESPRSSNTRSRESNSRTGPSKPNR